ncbi:MAG: exosortase/archaeosortase family protein [Anaerohalosphaeraceae bacterium]|nr:exosortase/archaeosortase family protein [Anaerohalosphaeraceae bacterium]
MELGINTNQQTGETQQGSWGQLGVHTYIKMAIIAIALYLLYNNEIYSIVHRWVNDSSWSHGFLIPVFSLYFLHQHKKEIVELEPKINYAGLFFLICCLIFFPLVIFVYKFGYFKSLVIIPTIASVVLFLGGWKLLKQTWLPIAYMVFAMPLPARIYNDITIPMRRLAATVAAQILSLVNHLEATSSGVVIDVVYKGIRMEPALDVAEACSGMRLLMAFLALGVAMAYLHYRPLWQRLVLLASTIPIAILSNTIRVTITGFIYILWDPKYAQGIYHDMLGMLMLPLAFGLYGLLAWFMSNLMEEEKQQVEEELIITRQDSSQR